MGFYDSEEFKEVMSTSVKFKEAKKKKRKELEEKIKTFDKRFENGDFIVKVIDGEGTYLSPFKVKIKGQNYNEDVISVHENEGNGYSINILYDIQKFLWMIRTKLQVEAGVEFFEIRFR